MTNLEKEPDTLTSPEDVLSPDILSPESVKNALQLAGTDNDLNQNQFIGGDQVNLLGDGVPGYEATGVSGTDDELEKQLEARNTPSFKPG
ncbi:hypothetical protein [Legionella fallonii]|uniref:Uncharacterized protein n=1 Tax=Legionella fallonii LLAP-10 TaxID=1212491 RepID=A0A098G5U1_9GAMM|nr:hypothetical protein [Legionella fallonii]CEG57873.1 conserved protein of unknown function [Legionella fallonii LLAP-10]